MIGHDLIEGRRKHFGMLAQEVFLELRYLHAVEVGLDLLLLILRLLLVLLPLQRIRALGLLKGALQWILTLRSHTRSDRLRRSRRFNRDRRILDRSGLLLSILPLYGHALRRTPGR